MPLAVVYVNQLPVCVYSRILKYLLLNAFDMQVEMHEVDLLTSPH